ncbi:MAG: BrnT family toxin [Pyrinomonadaceae bacterium]
MKFEWDTHKAKLDLHKHGVSFEEAITAVLDQFSATTLDPDHSVDETRFVIYGLSARGRLLAISYTTRGESLRIISARLTTA